MKRLALALCLALSTLASPARAGYPLPILDATDMTPTMTGINGALLSGSPSMLTRVGAYSTLSLYVVLTRAAATAVNMVCYAGPTAGILAPMAVVTVGSNGLMTAANSSWTYPVSASGTLRLLVGPLNDAYIQCTFSGTGATSDTISVYARLGGLP